jgi:hypothetical protein
VAITPHRSSNGPNDCQDSRRHGRRSEELPDRELLYLFWWGSHPGGATAVIIRSHELPDGGSIYSEESDYPEAGTFLIARSGMAGEEADGRFLEALLARNGQPFGVSLFGGPADEIRSLLPKAKLTSLIVQALGRANHEGGFDWLELVDLVDLDEDGEGVDLGDADLYVHPVTLEEAAAKMRELEERYPPGTRWRGLAISSAYRAWLREQGYEPYVPEENRSELERREVERNTRLVKLYLDRVLAE